MKNLFATAASVFVLGFAVPAMAQNSNSTVEQIGYHQSATIDQTGAAANNSSTVSQGLEPGFSARNEATVTQRGTGYIENYSTVKQDGYKNEATVTQEGNGSDLGYNSSIATQLGDKNDITVTQNADGTVWNTSTATQTGDHNDIIVNQSGPAVSWNNSSVTQNGNGNSANVTQH